MPSSWLLILAAVAVLIIAAAVVIALRPSNFRVKRSATVPAPPTVAFAQVNDLHKWEAWSPWAKLDPTMKQTYEGPPSGTGASYRWSGNNHVGEGRMTIVESHPHELLRIKLEFLRPFPGVNDVEFTFAPTGEQTLVTWNMSGKLNFMTKAFGLVMNMDKMVGGQFEQGLANLKSVVETECTKQHA